MRDSGQCFPGPADVREHQKQALTYLDDSTSHCSMKKHATTADRRSGLLSTSKRRQLGNPDQQAIVSGQDSLSDEQNGEPESVITQVRLTTAWCQVQGAVWHTAPGRQHLHAYESPATLTFWLFKPVGRIAECLWCAGQRAHTRDHLQHRPPG